MLPANEKPDMTGPHAPAFVGEGEAFWSFDNGSVFIAKYDDGTVLFASERDGQPTRCYELSKVDVAILLAVLS